MEDALISILEKFNVPVYRQGSMSNDEAYPDTFFTFWNNESQDHAHYDNADYGTDWDFDVNVYSTNPPLTYSLLEDAREALKAEGWIVPSRGHDVGSDEPTHTGRGMQALFLQTPKQEVKDNA